MKGSVQLQVKDKIEEGKNFKIARFRKEIRKTNPHKHNSYLEIIYLSDGSGAHFIDAQEYPVRPPVIFIVRMEQVHHWHLNEEPEGYVLILKKSFLDNTLDKELKELVSAVSAYGCLNLPECAILDQLFALLTNEYMPEKNNNTPVVEGLLKALLAKIMEVARPIELKTIPKTGLYEQFRDMLNQEIIKVNTVAFFADKLNTTPQNLNAICRKSSDLSATEVIAEYVITESKRLLRYTSLNVTEVAIALGFKDNSHFIKYFKRYTGQTPHSFRQA